MASTAAMALQQEDLDRDASFAKLMHGKSANQRSAFMSMLNKDGDSHRLVTDEYLKNWEADARAGDKTQEARDGRKDNYMPLVNNFYDLVTDLYEEGWAQSFHFCRFSIGEPFLQALARHEHYLAYMIKLRKGMKVLDVGCGVGGPAREIASFIGCNIVGLNNNGYQIERATSYAKRDGLADQVSFIKGDFMHIDQPEDSFDAVYAIEATVHAPSLQGVYEQIYRVLKPGGTFGVYEWVMTDKYDDTDSGHRAVRLGIERGNGIANMMTRKQAVESIKAAGFVLENAEDLAERADESPWYYPLAGEFGHIRTLTDLFTVLRTTRLGRTAMSSLLTVLETVRMAPQGTAETASELSLGADNLVAGAKQGLFTPMFLMIGKKPEE